jgi:hypothetical protein
MSIIQLSVFLENRLGRLDDVLQILKDNNINIRALSLADKANYGILRMIVDNPEKCITVLKKENVSVNFTPVVAVEVEDRPGGLHEVVKLLVEGGINIEYMYAFVEKTKDKAVVVFRVEDIEKAEECLVLAGKKVLEKEEIPF